MKIIYGSKQVEKLCTSMKEARKFFGGNEILARSLMARINAIEHAVVIKDIIMMPPFHFHKLQGDLKDYFAIDVKSRKDKWRIILRPLDENEKPFDPCYIDEIAPMVKIVEIVEVSAHYE